jgi:hypothetical protein
MSSGYPETLFMRFITNLENNYYREIVTYHDVLLSILACLVERWSGLGEMPSSASGEVLSQQYKQESKGRTS